MQACGHVSTAVCLHHGTCTIAPIPVWRRLLHHAQAWPSSLTFLWCSLPLPCSCFLAGRFEHRTATLPRWLLGRSWCQGRSQRGSSRPGLSTAGCRRGSKRRVWALGQISHIKSAALGIQPTSLPAHPSQGTTAGQQAAGHLNHTSLQQSLTVGPDQPHWHVVHARLLPSASQVTEP